jgi:hypothetical protein
MKKRNVALRSFDDLYILAPLNRSPELPCYTASGRYYPAIFCDHSLCPMFNRSLTKCDMAPEGELRRRPKSREKRPKPPSMDTTLRLNWKSEGWHYRKVEA